MVTLGVGNTAAWEEHRDIRGLGEGIMCNGKLLVFDCEMIVQLLVLACCM